MDNQNKWIDVTGKDVADPHQLGYDQYIEGTRTYDSLRYRNGAKLPFRVEWTDRFNVKHLIVLESTKDQYNLFVPCGTQILWNGYEKDKTGLDAQTELAFIQFSYAEPNMLQPHGIRVQVSGYKRSKMGEAKIDTESWNSALDLVKKGAEGASSIGQAIKSFQ